jgi:hypothetical protein
MKDKLVWQYSTFVDYVADASVNQKTLKAEDTRVAPARLLESLEFMQKIFERLNEMGNSSIKEQFDELHKALTDAADILRAMPFRLGDDAKFHAFLTLVVGRVHNLRLGNLMLVPAGWTHDENGDHLIMVALRRQEKAWSFAIINTGMDPHQGLEYHAAKPDLGSGTIKRNLAFSVFDVHPEKLKQSSFWMVLLWPLVYPTARNGPGDIYDRLLPYLNERPLMANIPTTCTQDEVPPVDWRTLPHGGDHSYCRCITEALRQCLRFVGMNSSQSEYVLMHIDWTLCSMIQHDLSMLTSLGGSDLILVKHAQQRLARSASVQAAKPHVSLEQLDAIEACLDDLERKLVPFENLVDKSMPPMLELPPELAVPGAAAWPLFGSFRRDGFSVESLAGDSQQPPILLPVQLTLVPDKVADFQEVCRALKECVHVCILLANQHTKIKNTACLRVSLIQHLFTRVLPTPLPPNHPNRGLECFWDSQPIRYADQADMLRHLHLISRHYAAAALSLNVTRSFDACRILTMACMSAVADSVMRKSATDSPSVFSLHYSGSAEGPSEAYGFDMSHFAVEADLLRFHDPHYAARLCQVLDYFTQQRKDLNDDHIIFGFERTMVAGEGETALIDQICLQSGYPREADGHPLLKYLTGEDPQLLDFIPEMGYFRDLVFMFKLLLAPTSQTLPEIRAWKPNEARLAWRIKGENVFAVAGFGKSLECAYVVDETTSKGLSRVFDYFERFKDKRPRVPPSGGDPSQLAAQKIESEEDVLHIRYLPDFGGRLKAADCELLLQMLTVPYIRIPLVVNFFSTAERITALNSEELQGALDACLFEFGEWQSSYDKDRPDIIPPPTRDHLKTPAGLLFNELANSPETLVQSIEAMLILICEMDTGKWSTSSKLILYIVRLVVRVEGYMVFMIEQKQSTSANAKVRGVDCVSDDKLAEIVAYRGRMRVRLNNQVFTMLDRWCDDATKNGQIQHANIVHAHMAYLFKNVTASELSVPIISTICIAQIFLTIHYRFDMGIKAGTTKARTNAESDAAVSLSLGIAQTEVFDIFQKHRGGVLAWLTAHPRENNEIMESIVRVLTFTGNRVKVLCRGVKAGNASISWCRGCVWWCHCEPCNRVTAPVLSRSPQCFVFVCFSPDDSPRAPRTSHATGAPCCSSAVPGAWCPIRRRKPGFGPKATRTWA